MADGTESNWPQWIQILVATVSGAAVAAGTLIRLAFSFNNRLQRIENQDLNAIMDARIATNHNGYLYPMLQTRVFEELKNVRDDIAQVQQDMAVLLERDRLAQRMEKIISALNRNSLQVEKED